MKGNNETCINLPRSLGINFKAKLDAAIFNKKRQHKLISKPLVLLNFVYIDFLNEMSSILYKCHFYFRMAHRKYQSTTSWCSLVHKAAIVCSVHEQRCFFTSVYGFLKNFRP